MKLNKLLQRLEIGFWTLIIGLMDNRRQLRLIPILVFPGMCLSVATVACFCSGMLKVTAPSRQISSRITTPRFEAPQLETPQLETPQLEPSHYATPQFETPQNEIVQPTNILKHVANGQRNVLLVLVDRLTSDSPRLQGVWLLACLPSSSHATFLPLYPSSKSGRQAEEDSLSGLFSLDRNGAPGLDFLNALSDKNIWWDYYLVLDNLALASVVELIGGVNLGQGELSGTQVMRFLSQPTQEPHAELMGQAMLAREFCSRIPVVFAGSNWEIQFELLTGHIYSDMELNSSRIDWARIRAFATALSCEFPTLPEIALSQPAP